MKLRPKIFRKAQTLVSPNGLDSRTRERFSCWAIGRAEYLRHWHEIRRLPEYQFYSAVFDLEDRTFEDRLRGFGYDSGKEAFTSRIIALELAALLVKDGFTVEDFRNADPQTAGAE